MLTNRIERIVKGYTKTYCIISTNRLYSVGVNDISIRKYTLFISFSP